MRRAWADSARGEAEAAHAPVHGGARDPEATGRLAHVPVGLVEGAAEALLLRALARGHPARGGATGLDATLATRLDAGLVAWLTGRFGAGFDAWLVGALGVEAPGEGLFERPTARPPGDDLCAATRDLALDVAGRGDHAG